MRGKIAVTYEIVTLCTECEGQKKVIEKRNGNRTIKVCPTCKGEGVLTENKQVAIPEEFMFDKPKQK